MLAEANYQIFQSFIPLIHKKDGAKPRSQSAAVSLLMGCVGVE